MKLTVIQNSTNYTLKMDNLTNPAKTLDLTDGEILLGYEKPLSAFYVELTETSPGTVPILDLKYFNGSTYVAITKVEDKTFGLTKCGFVRWDNTDLTEELSEVSNLSLYWYKLTTSDPASVAVKGINLVLSDDKDLIGFIPNIMSYKPSALDTMIGFHQEARNIIVQNIRNSGMRIKGCDDLNSKSVDQFDLLDIEEFRQAAKYLAAHLIFDNASKSDDDQYALKAANYLSRSENSMNSRLVGVDSNNDGKKDPAENNGMGSIKVVRT